MRILLASNSYPTPDYAVQAFIGVLCRELVRQGHEVTVLAPVMVLSCLKHGINIDRRHYFDEFESDGKKLSVEVFRPRIFAPSAARLTRVVSWICQKRISSEASRIGRRFDVAYAHFWSCAIHLMDYTAKTGTPLVVACGEDKINLRYLRSKRNITALAEMTRAVVCVSTKNRNECIAAGLTSADKTIVLPNAVDASVFKKMDKRETRELLGFPQDVFIVAFLGRFNDRKGAGRVNEAIRQCGDPGIKALYIGKPTASDTFRPTNDVALFYGSLPHDDVALYLNAADLFVLPSLAEGCSNAIVEAMACGLPVISSDLPFNNDILDSSNSILVNPMDTNAIAQAIEAIKQDSSRRLTLSEGALKTAAGLSIGSRTEKIVSFIKSKTGDIHY